MAKKSRVRAKPAGAAVMDPDVTEAIAQALLEEIADKGYLGMSMDGLARRAGVGKGAIYRRWPSKEHMTVDVLRQASDTDAELPDHGSFEQDVRALIAEVRHWQGRGRMGSVFPDVLAEGMRSEAMARLLTEAIEGPRRLRGLAVIERAAERGEVSPDANTELILDIMGALVFWRLIARRREVTDEHVDAIVALVMAEAQRPTA